MKEFSREFHSILPLKSETISGGEGGGEKKFCAPISSSFRARLMNFLAAAGLKISAVW